MSAAAPSPSWERLLPLVMATMTSQAVLVVLAPTIVDVARDFDASVAAVGQARSITAAAAIATSFAIGASIDRLGVRPLITWGALTAAAGLAASAAAPSLSTYLAAHIPAGIGFACLLSAGFAGVAGFPSERTAWAMGYVAGANALAWVVANPLIGWLTESVSWRAGQLVPVGLAAVVVLSAPYAAALRPAPAGEQGLTAVLRDRSARRWVLAELTAFFAWATTLTFTGAFLIVRHDLGESAVGLLLALAAAAYFVTSTRSGALSLRFPRRPLTASAALALGAAIALLFGVVFSWWLSVALLSAASIAAGVRTPASSALGITQLPGHPGAMMAARTATTQAGYLLGAAVGGLLLASAGFAALGAVMAVVMLASAVLVMGVVDRDAAAAVSPSGRTGSEIGDSAPGFADRAEQAPDGRQPQR